MALFIVLLFQLLFILFGMTLHVALTVHDKINFQNALDLGALYGAKKQAEVLNAIAHINFQMRQSWKLLAWRYRILGTVTKDKGDYVQAPGMLRALPHAWCPQNKTNKIHCALSHTPPPPSDVVCRRLESNASSRRIYGNGYCDIPYHICVSADAWQTIYENKDEDFCQTKDIVIPTIEPMTVIAGFLGPVTSAAATQVQLISGFERQCKGQGVLNWLMAQVFLSHFRLDQKDRKMMIQALYNETLKKGMALEKTAGSSIKDGVKATIEKNLTFVNIAAYRNESNPLVFFNSLSDSPGGPKDFDKVFLPHNTSPALAYFNLDVLSGHCESRLFPHYKTPRPTEWPTSFHVVHDHSSIKNYINSQANLFEYNRVSRADGPLLSTLTWSYYKKPDIKIYYGVKGKISRTDPALFTPFSSGTVTMKGSAFAKPFGGRIGPPPRSGPYPSPDPLIPEYIPVGATTGGDDYRVQQPNYSRYPGDKWGLVHRDLHDPKYGNINSSKALLIKRNDNPNTSPNPTVSGSGADDPTKSPYKIKYFANHLRATNIDPLARDATGNPFLFLRVMELMAVFPDVYDLVNYSISNNYMETYFPKICSLIGGGGSCPESSDPGKSITGEVDNSENVPGYIRGDFGWPDSYWDQNKNEQIPNSFLPFFYAPPGGTDDVKVDKIKVVPGENFNPAHYTGRKSRQSYMLKDPAHLLTGWSPSRKDTRYSYYYTDGKDTNMMNCFEKTLLSDRERQIPSGCAVGGRSGYSVKLISCGAVKASDFDPKPGDIGLSASSAPPSAPVWCP